MASHIVRLCSSQFVVRISIIEVILECSHNIHRALDDGGAQILVAIDDEEVVLYLEALEGEALIEQKIGTAVLRVSKHRCDVCSEVGSTVADGDWDIPDRGSPTRLDI